GRAHLSRRQPAYEAASLLGVADRGGAGPAPRGDLPLGSVHTAHDVEDAREGRLQPVRYLLHMAQLQGRAHGVFDATCAERLRRGSAAEPLADCTRNAATSP